MSISIDVRDYGATGDGSTNDWYPCQTALSTASGCGGSVYFPPGVYRCGSPLRLRNITAPLNLRGDGENVSVLTFEGEGLDLGFRQSDLHQQPYGLTMRDLGFRAVGNAGQAVSVSYGSPEKTNDHARPSVSIRDVVIESPEGHSWGGGVRLEGAWNSTLDNVFISGGSCGGDWNAMRGAGVELVGMCVNAHLSNVRTNFWDVGLKAHSNTEGIFCSNCSMVATKRGVWVKGDPATWPHRMSTLTWTGGLIEIRVGGVVTGSAAFHLEDCWTALINGAQMITETLQGGSTTYGVIAQDCRGVSVVNCDINAFNMGLIVTGGSTDFRNVGNTFPNTQTAVVGWGE